MSNSLYIFDATMDNFQQDVMELTRTMIGASRMANNMMERVRTMKQTILNTPAETKELMEEAGN